MRTRNAIKVSSALRTTSAYCTVLEEKKKKKSPPWCCGHPFNFLSGTLERVRRSRDNMGDKGLVLDGRSYHTMFGDSRAALLCLILTLGKVLYKVTRFKWFSLQWCLRPEVWWCEALPWHVTPVEQGTHFFWLWGLSDYSIIWDTIPSHVSKLSEICFTNAVQVT